MYMSKAKEGNNLKNYYGFCTSSQAPRCLTLYLAGRTAEQHTSSAYYQFADETKLQLVIIGAHHLTEHMIDRESTSASLADRTCLNLARIARIKWNAAEPPPERESLPCQKREYAFHRQ